MRSDGVPEAVAPGGSLLCAAVGLGEVAGGSGVRAGLGVCQQGWGLRACRCGHVPRSGNGCWASCSEKQLLFVNLIAPKINAAYSFSSLKASPLLCKCIVPCAFLTSLCATARYNELMGL